MTKQPNLLFIFTDQQAAKTMGAYGNNLIHTPNMDKLAEKSIVFKNAYVSQSVCTPSRSTILTGLYPHTTECTENNIPLHSDTHCFPELGNFVGYKRAYYGKWHLGDEIFTQHGFQEWRSIEDMYRWYYKGRDRTKHSTYHKFLIKNGFKPNITSEDGFQEFSREFSAHLPEEFSKPAYLSREASRFIKENRNNPFILYVNFLEPHPPLSSPRDGQYNPKDIPLPASFHHKLTKNQHFKAHLYRRALYEQFIIGAGPLKTENDWRHIIASYWGLVSLVDTHLGTILNTLDECGLTDNTIIVYTSDHGDMMGSHQLLAKCVMFEEAVKVPLLLKIPGLRSNGKHVDNLISQIDLVPTLLEAMDQSIPQHLQGFSWLPFLQGKKALSEQNVFVQWNGYDGPRGNFKGFHILDYWKGMASENKIIDALGDPVRTIITPDGWKYNFSPRGWNELYNLNIDPYEITNLVEETKYTGLIKELRTKIFQWQERTSDTLKLPD